MVKTIGPFVCAPGRAHYSGAVIGLKINAAQGIIPRAAMYFTPSSMGEAVYFLNFTVTVFALSMEMLQVVPVHPGTDQPARDEPLSGVAVRVTAVL